MREPMTGDGSDDGDLAGPAWRPPEGFAQYTPINPFGVTNGPFYQCDLPENDFIRAFRVLDRHVNSGGICHGGMLLAFADMVLGHKVRRVLGQAGATVQMSTSFLSPARVGDWIEGRAVLLRQTRTLVFVRADLSGQAGDGRVRPVLSAEAVFHGTMPQATRPATGP